VIMRSLVRGVAGSLVLLLSVTCSASIPKRPKTSKVNLVDQLSVIRGQVLYLQEDLVNSLHHQAQAESNLRKIHVLLKLQERETRLAKQRMTQLEGTIGDLQSRRAVLNERVVDHEQAIRKALIQIQASQSSDDSPGGADLPRAEVIEAPRRKVLANRVNQEIKEIEAVKADLDDADQLQGEIQGEQERLTYLFQDLKEKEGILELNRQLQADLLKKSIRERLDQLDNYRQLKSAEAEVESLIHRFNARVELERAQHAEKVATREMIEGVFSRLKGHLGLPIAGQVVSNFGRYLDPKTNLYIFKKGIDIAGGKNQPVRAVSSGKVAYSGELPDYGKLTIIDHGDHFYTICANLGALSMKVGDRVMAGQLIGKTDDLGTPVYFEIRSRNVAVNPLQWVSN